MAIFCMTWPILATLLILLNLQPDYDCLGYVEMGESQTLLTRKMTKPVRRNRVLLISGTIVMKDEVARLERIVG